MTEFDPWAAPTDDADPRKAAADLWNAAPRVACGRCGAANIDADTMFHLRWLCVAQDAWIEAALNDRKARPDRARQARRDLKARQTAAPDGGNPRQ